jgi:hypothetical protein
MYYRGGGGLEVGEGGCGFIANISFNGSGRLKPLKKFWFGNGSATAYQDRNKSVDQIKDQTPQPLVRKRTLPTELPPIVGEL